ncbi:hypothetical protein FB451DRAFT_1407116 [Mycena latifolia]|nr:hypothetical protein FB451DRAFT_1407116 [Mycena latifolia]
MSYSPVSSLRSGISMVVFRGDVDPNSLPDTPLSIDQDPEIFPSLADLEQELEQINQSLYDHSSAPSYNDDELVTVSEEHSPIMPPDRPSLELGAAAARASTASPEVLRTPTGGFQHLLTERAIPFAYFTPHLPSYDDAIAQGVATMVLFHHQAAFAPPGLTTPMEVNLVTTADTESAPRQPTIVHVVQPDGKPTLQEVECGPGSRVQEGMVMECAGTLVGEWCVTSWKFREKDWTYMIWLNLPARYWTLIRLRNHLVQPPTLTMKAKMLFRSFTNVFFEHRMILPTVVNVNIQ